MVSMVRERRIVSMPGAWLAEPMASAVHRLRAQRFKGPRTASASVMPTMVVPSRHSPCIKNSDVLSIPGFPAGADGGLSMNRTNSGPLGAGLVAANNPWPGLAAAIAATSIVGVTVGGVAPLLSLNLERLGVESTVSGLMGAVPALAMVSASAFVPIIIRRLGAAPSICSGCALAGAILLCFTALRYVPAWFVLRYVMALGMGLTFVVSETWINALAPAGKRGLVMGIYVALFCVGLSAGPLLIGFIGSEGNLPFVIIAMVTLLAILPISIASRSGAPDLRGHPTMPLRRAFVQASIVMIATFVNGAIWIAMLALLPIYGVRSGLAENQALQLLTAYAIGNIVLQLPLGRLLDRWSAPLVLALCGIAQLVGALALPFVVREASLAWPLLIIWGGTLGGIYTVAITMLGRTFATDQLTGAASAQALAFELGAIAGPLLAGIGMRIWNPDGMLIVIGTAGAALAYIGLRAHVALRPSPSR